MEFARSLLGVRRKCLSKSLLQVVQGEMPAVEHVSKDGHFNLGEIVIRFGDIECKRCNNQALLRVVDGFQ